MIDITQVVVALVGLLAAIVTTFAVPWLRANIDAQKWAQFERIVSVAVAAAEQLGVTDVVKNKYEYAYAHVTEELEGRGLKFDGKLVRAAIEAEVLKINSM